MQSLGVQNGDVIIVVQGKITYSVDQSPVNLESLDKD